MSPGYSPAAVAVADDGGVFAVACIRGGAEDGEDWHRAACGPQAAGVRRLRGGRRLAGGRGADEPGPPGHPGRQQRRAAGGDLAHPAAGPVPGGGVRRPADRHGALPAVPHRQAVDPGVRRPGGGRGVRLAVGLLAVPPPGRGHVLPGHAGAHRRGGQPGRPGARPQVRGRAGVGHLVPRRSARAGAGRVPGRARPGQAGVQAGRRGRPTCTPSCAGSSAWAPGDRRLRGATATTGDRGPRGGGGRAPARPCGSTRPRSTPWPPPWSPTSPRCCRRSAPAATRRPWPPWCWPGTPSTSGRAGSRTCASGPACRGPARWPPASPTTPSGTGRPPPPGWRPPTRRRAPRSSTSRTPARSTTSWPCSPGPGATSAPCWASGSSGRPPPWSARRAGRRRRWWRGSTPCR